MAEKTPQSLSNESGCASANPAQKDLEADSKALTESKAAQLSTDKAELEPAEPGTVEPGTLEHRPTEHGGPKGLEPTRYGDWEKNGRCTDF